MSSVPSPTRSFRCEVPSVCRRANLYQGQFRSLRGKCIFFSSSTEMGGARGWRINLRLTPAVKKVVNRRNGTSQPFGTPSSLQVFLLVDSGSLVTHENCSVPAGLSHPGCLVQYDTSRTPGGWGRLVSGEFSTLLRSSVRFTLRKSSLWLLLYRPKHN